MLPDHSPRNMVTHLSKINAKIHTPNQRKACASLSKTRQRRIDLEKQMQFMSWLCSRAFASLIFLELFASALPGRFAARKLRLEIGDLVFNTLILVTQHSYLVNHSHV